MIVKQKHLFKNYRPTSLQFLNWVSRCVRIYYKPNFGPT